VFQAELKPMMKKGVCGFKCFLIHSGVDEFPHVVESDVCEALEQMKDTNSVLLVWPLPMRRELFQVSKLRH